MTRYENMDFFNSFSEKKILVLGDVMLDEYIWGSVDRISPEAPVPVVHIRNREYRLGGAGNVALNIRHLGAVPLLVSVTGNDEMSDKLSEILKTSSIANDFLLKSSKRITTIKTRVIANHQQQLIRIDSEDPSPLNEFDQNLLLAKIREILPLADAVIFSDYDKGVITPTVIQEVIRESNRLNIPTIVDPKKLNFLHYKHATLFKPNLKELQDGLHIHIERPVVPEQISAAAKQLFEQLELQIVFITLSDEGVYLDDRKTKKIIPSHRRNIYDVSGAGDTVSAVAALSMACQLDLLLMAELTNLAGGIVCEKVGVVPVELEELKSEYEKVVKFSGKTR